MILLVLCTFLFGFIAVVAQASVIRELLVVLGGNELSVGVTLGAWLAGVAFGGAVASVFVDRTRRMRLLLAFSSLGLVIAMPAVIFAVRSGHLLMRVPAGQLFSPVGLLVLSVAGTVPLAFFVGYGFASLCRIYAGESRKTGTAVGTVYVLEGLGSVTGGAVFTFVLAGRFDPFSIAAASGLCLLTVTGLVMMGSVGRRYTGTGISCFAIALLMGIALVTDQTGRLDLLTVYARWQSAHPSMKLMDCRDTVYQNISVGEREGQYSFFGNGSFLTSLPDDYESARRAHLLMAQHEGAASVLVVGGGLEGTVGEILLHPVERVDHVNLDPVYTEMVGDYVKALNRGQWLSDERLNIHDADGRAFISSTPDSYDIVFVNVPDPASTMLNRYYTREFFQEIRSILNPGGVAAITVSAASSSNISKEVRGLAGTVYSTLTSVFAHCVISPGETVYMFASDSEASVTDDIDILSLRYRESGAGSEFFVPEVYAQAFPEDRIEQMTELLSLPDRINRDMEPVTYFYGLVLWARYAGSGVSDFLMEARESAHPVWAGGILLCVFAAVTGVMVNRGSRSYAVRSSTLISIGTTGFVSMTASLAVMMAFQAFRGCVYQQIGILIGSLMAGIAAGGLISTVWISGRGPEKRVSDSLKLLVWTDGAVVCAVIVLPVALHVFGKMGSSPIIMDMPFYVLAGVIGLVTGMEFPLGARVFQTEGEKDVGRSSGLMEWSDHLGGMLGALLGGVVLLPLLGTTGVCVFAVALKMVSLAGLMGACYRGVE